MLFLFICFDNFKYEGSVYIVGYFYYLCVIWIDGKLWNLFKINKIDNKEHLQDRNYFDLRFTKIDCSVSEKNSTSEHFCFVKAYSRTHTTINFGYNLNREMNKSYVSWTDWNRLVINTLLDRSNINWITNMEHSTVQFSKQKLNGVNWWKKCQKISYLIWLSIL